MIFIYVVLYILPLVFIFTAVKPQEKTVNVLLNFYMGMLCDYCDGKC